MFIASLDNKTNSDVFLNLHENTSSDVSGFKFKGKHVMIWWIDFLKLAYCPNWLCESKVELGS